MKILTAMQNTQLFENGVRPAGVHAKAIQVCYFHAIQMIHNKNLTKHKHFFQTTCSRSAPQHRVFRQIEHILQQLLLFCM